jgi:cob(I)alamin adenosyltransferase
MLAVTGTGDDGTTGLLGGGRARKDDPRIEAFGAVDEASSAIGLAKGLTADERVRELCEELQRGLYRLGAQLATDPADAGKFGAIEAADVVGLETIAAGLEAEVPMPTGFILPGATPASGALDLARAVVRRAERRCLALPGVPPEAMAYLNRMSLLLFILGRYEEHRAGVETRPAKTGRRDAQGLN